MLTILHTAAHPADAFDTVGGTLAHHIRRGDRVVVVVFSHGARSHAITTIEQRKHGGNGAATLEQAIEDKRQEVVEACRILGIDDVRFFEYDDHLLLVKEEYVVSLARLIREVKPDVIITHSPFEQVGLTTTHRVCCDITMLARSIAGGIMDDDSQPHRVGEVFFMHQHGETTIGDHVLPRYPEVLIDVTDVVHLKVQALDRIVSQYYPGNAGRKMMETINGSHGLHMCVPYCEAFMRYQPAVYDLLPVCEHNLRVAREPMAKTYDRLGAFIAPNVPLNGQREESKR